MAQKVIHLTQAGFDKFEAELDYLRKIRRAEVANRLHIALDEGGELVENAEYEDAKNEQAFVEGRILELENMIQFAQIITDEGPKDTVRINSLVTVQEGKDDPETFHIVGPAEANPREGKISYESPLGQSLMGHKVSDKVTIKAPDGDFMYKILSIE